MKKMSFNPGIAKITICLLALLLCSCGLFAEVQEFSEKVNGDIYGQVRVIGDMDDDGIKDMIFGATDGKVHLFSSSGKEIFRPPFWPAQLDSPILAPIEVADFDKNGDYEILASTKGGTVYCLDSKGRKKWTFDTGNDNLISSPVVRDGTLDILVPIKSAGGAGGIVRIDPDGSILNGFHLDRAVQAPMVSIDVDKSSDKDVIVKDTSGKISVFKKDGELISEFNFSNNFISTEWPFAVGASDLDGDGFSEIYTTDSDGSRGVFKMWSHSGELLSSFPITDPSHGAPKIADIDGDGTDDIIIAQADGTILVCDKKGNPKKGWPYQTSFNINSSPSILDIDGDGYNDIVFTAINPKGGNDSTAGCIMALNRNGKVLEGFPKWIGKSVAPLTFADLDGNGKLEMIAVGGIGFTGPQLNVFKTKAKLKFRIVTVRQETKIK